MFVLTSICGVGAFRDINMADTCAAADGADSKLREDVLPDILHWLNIYIHILYMLSYFVD